MKECARFKSGYTIRGSEYWYCFYCKHIWFSKYDPFRPWECYNNSFGNLADQWRKTMPTLLEKVAGDIKNLAPSAFTMLIQNLQDRDIEKISQAGAQVWDAICKMENDLKKIKPDQEMYDAKGTKTGESYSKAKTEEKRKLEEKLTKAKRIFEKSFADDNNDFNELFQLAKGGGDKGGDTKEQD